MLSNTGSTETVVEYVIWQSLPFCSTGYNNESCPTADRSNTDQPNGQAYQTGELLDTTPFTQGTFPKISIDPTAVVS